MKKNGTRLLAGMLCGLLLAGCTPADPQQRDVEPIAVSANADPVLHAEDGFVQLDSDISDLLQCQMLIPKALGWYETSAGIVRYCDASGTSRLTLEYRAGDSCTRCKDSYLHDIGSRISGDRIRSYEPQTVGQSGCTAYRIDVRELEQDQPEHMITYWFLEPPAAGKRGGCYIVTTDTTAENLDVLMRCIPTFARPDDFDPETAGKETVS